ncbi:hypothetical protein Tco_1049967 [Tanacetum coccineum]
MAIRLMCLVVICSSNGIVPEQINWLHSKEIASQNSNPPKPVTPLSILVQSTYCVLEKKNLQIEKKNILIQNECLINDSIAKDICSIVLASDRDRPLSEELRPTVGSFDKQALESKLTQLKDAITLVRIQNDRFKVENENVKRRYQELSATNTYTHVMTLNGQRLLLRLNAEKRPN